MKKASTIALLLFAACRPATSVDRVVADDPADVMDASAPTAPIVAVADAAPSEDATAAYDEFAPCALRATTSTTGWTTAKLRDFTFVYPGSIFKKASFGATKATLLAPTVHAEAMDGSTVNFRVVVEIVAKPALAAMKPRWDPATMGFDGGVGELAEAGVGAESVVLGAPAYCLVTGIEGTYALDIYAPLGKETLYVHVDWVTDFANPSLTVSGDDQLAIASEIVRSVRRATK